jgi:hypothetical protein
MVRLESNLKDYLNEIEPKLENFKVIEDYSESGAKVQVLCLRKREVVGIGRRAGASHRDSCPGS